VILPTHTPPPCRDPRRQTDVIQPSNAWNRQILFSRGLFQRVLYSLEAANGLWGGILWRPKVQLHVRKGFFHVRKVLFHAPKEFFRGLKVLFHGLQLFFFVTEMTVARVERVLSFADTAVARAEIVLSRTESTVLRAEMGVSSLDTVLPAVGGRLSFMG